MLFGLFESKIEKELRLLKLDLENERERKDAKKKNRPYFGIRYVDDYRK